MEIKDLKPNTGNVDLVLEVVEKEEPRTFEKFGKVGKVCNAKVKDETGEIKLTLWNEDIDNVNAGDKIHLENGWCSEYRDELQISAGKFGKIEIVGKAQPEIVTNDPRILNRGMPEEMLESSDEVAEENGEGQGQIIDEETVE